VRGSSPTGRHHHDEVLDVRQLRRQRAERGRERVVDEDDPVLGVVMT